ncbi:MAG: hypothetical protein KC964_27440, partial [Candidatus Omnitrophica bacterium]|nr:hypothetical protein [Candidatus Omnitrophota bacterium]
IRRNVIAYNTTPNAHSHRAGISFCDGTIEFNRIFGNKTQGGGAGISDCDGTIKNNLIFGNEADGGGPGIVSCDGPILNNVVYGNSTVEVGGGLWDCNGEIRNNVIWGNVSGEGFQVEASSIPSYCCIQDWAGMGAGNTALDPQFVDAEVGDFRLLPTSPCIDAGAYVSSVTTDFWNEPRGLDGVADLRGDGSNYDIGAHEFLGKELFNLGSDMDQTGWVDAVDLLTFQRDWNAAPPISTRSDLNRDNLIDPLDLTILVRDWHRGTGVR